MHLQFRQKKKNSVGGRLKFLRHDISRRCMSTDGVRLDSGKMRGQCRKMHEVTLMSGKSPMYSSPTLNWWLWGSWDEEVFFRRMGERADDRRSQDLDRWVMSQSDSNLPLYTWVCGYAWQHLRAGLFLTFKELDESLLWKCDVSHRNRVMKFDGCK